MCLSLSASSLKSSPLADIASDMADSTSTTLPAAAADTATPDTAPLTHVQQVWDRIRSKSTIYRILLSDTKLISATHGRIIARLDLEPVHLNSGQSLHGSVSATIVDWAGGLAIASTGLDRTGVSTDIHVSYVSGARLGETIEIEAWVNKVGRNLAYTMVEIRKLGADGVKGPVVCTGSHTKFLNTK